MRLKIVGILLCLTFLVGGVLSVAAQSVLGEPASDRLISSKIVPQGKSPHGEVRLLLRGDAIVVQTILYSKVLKKVLAVIERKETRFWTDEKAGYVDSMRYGEALYQDFTEIWRRFKERENREERRQAMLIEFSVSEQAARVEIYAPSLTGEPGTLQILAQQPLNSLRVSRRYAIGSLFEICRDSLGLETEPLLNQLEAAQPTSSWLRTELNNLAQ